jgi:hypothetical protein
MSRLTLCLALFAVAVFAGCQSLTVAPNYTAPAIQLQPLAAPQLVGDATGQAQGTVILGLITLGVDSKYASVPGIGLLPCKIEANAVYKAFMSVPNCDALVCPVVTIDETNYFVFKKKSVSVRAKAVTYAITGLVAPK